MASPQLMLFSILFIGAAFMYNGFGVTVVRYTSATTRAIVEQLRIITIWVFFLMKPGFGHETFSWI